MKDATINTTYGGLNRVKISLLLTELRRFSSDFQVLPQETFPIEFSRNSSLITGPIVLNFVPNQRKQGQIFFSASAERQIVTGTAKIPDPAFSHH